MKSGRGLAEGASRQVLLIALAVLVVLLLVLAVGAEAMVLG